MSKEENLKSAELALLLARGVTATAQKKLQEARASQSQAQELVARARFALAETVPVDTSDTTLTDGSPVTTDHKEIQPNGQQKGYIVLSEAERAKGFVRPVRDSYVHVGEKPTYPLRDITEEEGRQFNTPEKPCEYVKFEEYPDELRPRVGRFWTQAELDGGCGATTTMVRVLAETYARSPSFYSGTYCSTCRNHFPVGNFVWEGTTEVLGS